MVKNVAWCWVITIITLSIVTTGQPTYTLHSITGSCFNPMQSLCFYPPLGIDFLVFHQICMFTKNLGRIANLLKAGEHLATDALDTLTHEPSLQPSLHRLSAALNQFSKRVEQMRRQATQTCGVR
jgi:hypothetical protein